MITKVSIVLTLMLLAGAAPCPGQTEGHAAGSRRKAASAKLLSPSPAAARRVGNLPKKQGEIWSGSSGGVAITWSDKDLRIRGGKSGPFSYAADARRSWKRSALEERDACEYETKLRVLSVVGSIVSVECSDYTGCSAWERGYLETRDEAFDASSPQIRGRVKLTDYFPAKDILEALLSDTLVKQGISPEDGPPPGTLEELIARLSGSGACEYQFNDDLLYRFAFHHLKGDKVAVRIGLSHGAMVCRGALTQIGILLPIPPSLADALHAAGSRRSGYLMNDLREIAGEQIMSISGSASAVR